MILPGQIYQHSKGTYYEVVCIATDSETLEDRVVYKVWDPNQPKVWDRPLRMWEEVVLWPDGVMRPRFVQEKEKYVWK